MAAGWLVSAAALGVGSIVLVAARAAGPTSGRSGATLEFRAQEIASGFGVGYAVVPGDVNGDGRTDILAISGTDLVWFPAPTWEKNVILGAGATTPDNVTIAPHDIDKDGRLDVALGAGWSGQNTGTLQWVRQNAPGATPAWEVLPISAEPTLHRIRWADVDGDRNLELIVAPLHGKGAKGPDWDGPSARVLVFRPPAHPRTDPWPMEVAAEANHIQHNFLPLNLDQDRQDELITASKEGLYALKRSQDGTWSRTLIGEGAPGEVKAGRVAGRRMLATVDPWHGARIVIYAEKPGVWASTVIETALTEGHALAWADFDRDGNDELAAGWRGAPAPGVAIYVVDRDGALKSKTMVDAGGMATEDLVVGDFNGDKRPDIVASGRSTRNIKIYWNETKATRWKNFKPPPRGRDAGRRPFRLRGILESMPAWPVAVRFLALAPGILSLCLVGTATTETPGAARSAPSPAARLLELQREATDLLKQTARAAVGHDEVQRLLGEAARRIEALSAEPDTHVGSSPAEAALLSATLRAELHRAAGELRSARPPRPEETTRFDARPYLDLLERARAQLQGEIALGLGFQGSYSQSKPQEPVYGGHASAMGPPPIPVAPAGDAAAASPSPAQFEEVPALAARTYGGGPTKDHILESGGSGLALLDYDGDGRLDIYLVTAAELTVARQRVPHRNTLYRNLGQMRFEDVSQKAGVDAAAWGNGVCAGDFDDDGRLDLYVTNWGPNLLFRNKGDGTFSEVATPAGVAAGGWSTGCAFLDADADGDLDLYVARYVHATWDEVVGARRTLTWRNGPRIMVGPAGLPGESDLFFENRGNGTFVEVTEAHGLGDPARSYGFGVVATDYDDDGWIDLFVANDSNPNFLHHNRGNGTFESAGLLSGVAVNAEGRAQAGMGVDSGDYDGDGRLDLVVTTFAHDASSLYKNLDGTRFEDVTAASGLAAPTFEPMGWGAAFLDADLDGRLDLFFANGHIFADIGDFPALKETFRQKNQLLLNQGTSFRDVSASAGAGLQVQKVSRGLAVGDLDDDGDLDVVVSNMDDVPTLLENRQRTGNHWVAFRLVSPGPNRFAIGARVTLEAAGRRQVREIRSGGSYLSQSDLRAHFGLGSHAGPVDVEVRMPGGDRWRWRGLQGDRRHELVLSESRRAGDR